MVATFIHIGDLHAGPGPRNADRYRALDQIIDAHCRARDVDAWLWPGDLNHGRMTIEDRNELAERLVDMATVAPVVLCYGNHDLPGDLDVFGRLQARHPITVVATPQVVRIDLARQKSRQASIFVLPYPTKAGLTAMGVAAPDIIDTAADALESIFQQAASELAAARADGDLVLMIGHVNVGGAIASTGQPNIGREIEISARHLDLLGDIYKGLNHVHKPQEIAGAYYAGSVCRLNWGETEKKSYLVVRVDETTYTVERRAIDVAPMYHVDGALTRDAFTWHALGPDAPLNGGAIDWSGCEVRVRYTFPQSARGLVDVDRVRREFAGARRLELEPIAVPDRQLRAPEVAAARTLPEKFTAYCAASGITATEGLQAKLARLEHADPLALLSEVQTALGALEAGETAQVAA